MTRMITAALALVALIAVPIQAHHSAASLGTVRITQPVMAGGTMLQPGTYEIRDTAEHPKPLPGQSEEARTSIEFLANGKVVARDAAEVMSAADAPVGTSGGAAGGRFQILKGGDFGRVAMSRGSERYLIHLPVAGK
jgi:hypothetical protein